MKMNSMKNIKRNIGKYSALGFVIFIILLISIVALIVNNSAKGVVEYYNEMYGRVVTIDSNREVEENTDDEHDLFFLDNLTEVEYQQIANSEFVQSVNYEKSLLLKADEVNVGKKNNGLTLSTSMLMFNLIGLTDVSTSPYFQNSSYKLVSGKYPNKINEILISQETLNSSELDIGDEVEYYVATNDEISSFEIVGTYSTDINTSAESIIFTPINTLKKMNVSTKNQAYYTLNSYKNVENFEQELYDNGLDQKYFVNNNKQVISAVVGPINVTMNILNILMFITLSLGGILIVFINILLLYSRKKEIISLRMFGLSKKSLLLIYIKEVAKISIVVLIYSLFFAAVLAEPISSYLINIVVNTGDMLQQHEVMMGSYQNSINYDVTTIMNIRTYVSIDVVFKAIIINIIIICISAVVYINMLNKYEPKEILRSQYDEYFRSK